MTKSSSRAELIARETGLGERRRVRDRRRHLVLGNARLESHDARERHIVVDQHAHAGLAADHAADFDRVVVVGDIPVIHHENFARGPHRTSRSEQWSEKPGWARAIDDDPHA